MIIYKATNKINGKVYIGQTVRSLQERMAEHARHTQTTFDRALKKYGLDAFDIEQIDSADSVDELNQKEIYWIEFYNCVVPNGYNMCEGGGNTKGFHHKEESKRKMAEIKSTSYWGENNPFFGKTHSEEARQKMSAKRKGMAHLTPEAIQKVRASHYKAKVRNIDTGEVFDSVKEAALKYGLKDTHITRVCKGHRKRTGGFRWEHIG